MNAQAAYAGSGATQIALHITRQRRQLLAEQMRIALFQVLEKERFGHVAELTVVDQVLHQFLAVSIERVKHAVVDPVEFQRRDIEQFAQTLIERGVALTQRPPRYSSV